MTFLRELSPHIDTATQDAELSDEVVECVVDLLKCVSALLAVADAQALPIL